MKNEVRQTEEVFPSDTQTNSHILPSINGHGPTGGQPNPVITIHKISSLNATSHLPVPSINSPLVSSPLVSSITKLNRMDTLVLDEESKIDSNRNRIEKEAEAYSAPTSMHPIPPDGGFGWVVVFASFMCNIIVDGILFSFGILLLEIASEFSESRANTAWINSLQTGFYLIVGPVVSSLEKKLDYRKLVIIGSVLAAIGFILSYFATNIITLYFTFGILGGIGFGFIFLPAIVTVGHYFSKRRAFATGIAVCGSGVGTFILPPIIQLIVGSVGWRNCLLVLAAITMSCAFFGSFFKPLKPIKPPAKTPRTIPEVKVNEQVTENCQGMPKPLLIRIKEARAAEWAASDDTINEESPGASQNSAPPPYSEVLNIIQLSDEIDRFPRKLLPNRVTGSVSHSFRRSNENVNRRRTRSALDRKETLTTPNLNEMLYSNLSLVIPPKTRSTLNLHQSTDEDIAAAIREEEEEAQEGFWETILKGFDLKLLKRPSFLLLSISGFLCLVGLAIPFIYISDRAKLLGLPPDKCAFVLSIIGVTNTIGRVFCGWASDNSVSPLMLNNIALTVGGIATIISPIVFNTYPLLIFYASIFGFSIATFATLRTVITVQLLGVERLNSAFGLLLLFQGLAVTIGSPLAGWFFDITGSYDYSFFLSGGTILLSGIMCYPLDAIANWEKKNLDEISLSEGGSSQGECSITEV